MRYRTATSEDLDALVKLYKTVAGTEGGIARLENEITPDYVRNFLEKSLASGLIIVGEHPDNADELVAEIHAYKAGFSRTIRMITNMIDRKANNSHNKNATKNEVNDRSI